MNDLNICYMCGTKENLQHYATGFKCEDCYMKGLEDKRMGSFDTPDYELPNYLKGSMKKKKEDYNGMGRIKNIWCNEEQNIIQAVYKEDYEKLVELKDKLSLENKDLRQIILEMDKLIVNMHVKEKELEKEIEEMKRIKVCMTCQVSEKETIDKWISKGRYQFVDNCLQEDCEMCDGEEKEIIVTQSKTKFGEFIENTSYGFVDSWMLSYKVEGMKEPIIQHHLTQEECEIIYGNMNNITYWFMEKMK